MQLYAGGSSQFIEDAVQNQVAEKLRGVFLEHHRFVDPRIDQNART